MILQKGENKMKKLLLALFAGSLFAGCVTHEKTSSMTADEKELASRLPGVFARAEEQCLAMIKKMNLPENATLKTRKGKVVPAFPRSFENGKMNLIGPRDWCSGFFPGSLWYLYEYTGKESWKREAKIWTDKLECIRNFTGNHDIGFMLYCSAGNGWRLAKCEGYDAILRDAAKALCKRYNEKIGVIRSWDNWQKGDHFQVIVDNMMNLELLEWAAKNCGDKRAAEVAKSHADMTDRNHFRADSTAFHVLDYNPENGKIFSYKAGQGASADGTWARGQAWAVYGFTMMYRETGDKAYLKRAMRCADYVLKEPNVPADRIPYWDFKASGIPNEERDASAAAITASALLELSTFAGSEKGSEYREYAVKQLLALSSPAYLAKPGTNGDFILMHSVGHKPAAGEVDVPINYADYYFLEALIRFNKSVK